MTAGVSIELKGIAKTYAGGVQALKPTDLAVARGETLVFLGPSGCGKTTCLRLIAGLEMPDPNGSLRFDGEDVTRTEIEDRNVGMVFQSYALFPNMSVAENIGYGLKVRKIAPAERDRRVREMLALCGIEALSERAIDQLSGGQRQRVALARAVAIRPRVLLLDEPLTALDAALRERLRGELDQLLRSLGITSIYVTHDQAEAMALGDRIVVMRQGAIAQIGAPRDIYFRPASRFVAEFVGAANVLSGEVRDGSLHLEGGKLALAGTGVGHDRSLMVMLRPESIRLIAPDQAVWRGRISAVSFLGDRQRVTVTGAAAQPVTVEPGNDLELAIGDLVGLDPAPGSLVVIPKETDSA
jgi:putative spermidine/putrescine transport system ATP-binding protein